MPSCWAGSSAPICSGQLQAERRQLPASLLTQLRAAQACSLAASRGTAAHLRDPCSPSQPRDSSSPASKSRLAQLQPTCASVPHQPPICSQVHLKVAILIDQACGYWCKWLHGSLDSPWPKQVIASEG